MKVISLEKTKEVIASHRDIYHQCILQIAKDLEIIDDWCLPKAYSISELYTSLLPIIQRNLELNASSLMGLLYKIDLNEALLNKKMLEGEHSGLADLLTEMIVEREAKKVIMRNVYAGKLII